MKALMKKKIIIFLFPKFNNYCYALQPVSLSFREFAIHHFEESERIYLQFFLYVVQDVGI